MINFSGEKEDLSKEARRYVGAIAYNAAYSYTCNLATATVLPAPSQASRTKARLNAAANVTLSDNNQSHVP